MHNIPKLPLLLLLSTLLSLTYLYHFSVPFRTMLRPTTLARTITQTRPNVRPTTKPKDLRIRPGYTSYETYLNHQLNKTLNPKLRQLWKTRDWDRKIRVFTQFFSTLIQTKLLTKTSRALCIGARVGQEVVALRQLGVTDSVGMDLVPHPPYVVQGDFHYQPFGDESFDFEFSNVFDHALYPEKFVGEIERTLKVGGICVLHVSVSKRADKYSANDLFSVKGLVDLFKVSEVVRVREIDGFGLDTEVVLRKTKQLLS